MVVGDCDERGNQALDGGTRQRTSAWSPLRPIQRKLVLARIPSAGSFTAIFQSALALGVLSRRYAYQRALVAKRERGGGRRLWPRTETPASDAAIKVAETGDFHVALARLLLERPNQATPAVRRFWRCVASGRASLLAFQMLLNADVPDRDPYM